MIDRLVILGGSSVYIPEFIMSALSHNVLLREVVLFGKPGRKLEVVSAFCQRLVDKNGYATKIIAETDLATAVRGASYIINHVRIGGMKARVRDEKWPPQCDMVGSDSIGAGAIANALRTLPVVFEFARIIEAEAPKAVFINLTNPVGIIVEALTQHTNLKVAGISDLPNVYIQKIAALLGRAPHEITPNYIGLFDLGWVQDVKVEGISRMGQILDLIDGSGDECFDYTLIRLFRMIPTRTTGMYFHRNEILKQQQTSARSRADILYDVERRILRLYANTSLNTVPDLTRQRNALWYEYTLTPLLLALENAKSTPFVLCVPNNGAITDLPDYCSVEIPVHVSKSGFKTRKIGMFPRFLKGMYCAIKESDRLVVEAVCHNSYDHALQALAVNPFVNSVDKAKCFLDRVIRKEHLALR